ncbi:MAG: T9SS type A sorting domain-containing protein [Ignavibacteriae bacterium]|nr:T9SS type A sorting domain-containing protein [Ignavibacteriota bacterium]
MLLYDSSATTEWGAIFVRVNAPADTLQSFIDGFLNVERGDIITMTGLISEFPNTITLMNSVTQLQPIPGITINIEGTSPLPAPIPKTVGDFYQGIFPAGGRPVRYSTGEPFESMLVLLTDLTVDFRVNTARGTFSAVDASGNQITNYDASKYYTLGHGGTLPQPGDSIWATLYPPVGARIDSISGYITTVSGSENPRGFRIAPVDREDLTIGFVLPSVTTHRRNPVVVPPDSNGRVSVRVTQQQGGYPIASVSLLYSLNNGSFTDLSMTFQASDTTYNAAIPQQVANTFVHYFIKATDNQGNSAILASSAIGGAASDTSKGFFFYTVLDRPLTINDLQYTPYVNGRGAYIGAQVSVSGLVTADTANLMPSPLNTGGTNAWYMQSGNTPWNGLWFVGTLDSLGSLRNGDSITITGSVAEQFDVTRVQNVNNRAVVHSTGNPEPAPVVLPTSTFGPTVGNGTPSAEQYEGMLVRFNNVTVTDVNPVFSDPTEFAISDGSGEVLVRRDGTHNYSNVEADTIIGKTILYQGTQISFLQGVIYYSFNRYKITPRKNSDFGTVTGVRIDRDPDVPASYSLAQNYPNPFNPSTSIEYTLPASETVTLKIYNLLGQEVKTLVNESQAPGRYTVRFDASSLSSGVYFYRLQAGQFSELKKMLLVK